MNIEELRTACESTIAGGGQCITLAIPSEVRIGRKGWPRGELICVNSIGGRVVRYKAASLLRFLKKAEREKRA